MGFEISCRITGRHSFQQSKVKCDNCGMTIKEMARHKYWRMWQRFPEVREAVEAALKLDNRNSHG